jgi:hypothetical protein
MNFCGVIQTASKQYALGAWMVFGGKLHVQFNPNLILSLSPHEYKFRFSNDLIPLPCFCDQGKELWVGPQAHPALPNCGWNQTREHCQRQTA